jgi:hypothetical protein
MNRPRVRDVDATTYSRGHHHVRDVRGRPKLCEDCGATDSSKRYEWASLTGNYLDVMDYKRLCRACHIKFDDIGGRISETWWEGHSKTECPNGHPFSEATLYVSARGSRSCRPCHSAHVKRNTDRVRDEYNAKRRALSAARRAQGITVRRKDTPYKSHCKAGHPYDEANARIVPATGQLHCRACNQIACEKYRLRKQLATVEAQS